MCRGADPPDTPPPAGLHPSPLPARCTISSKPPSLADPGSSAQFVLQTRVPRGEGRSILPKSYCPGERHPKAIPQRTGGCGWALTALRSGPRRPRRFGLGLSREAIGLQQGRTPAPEGCNIRWAESHHPSDNKAGEITRASLYGKESQAPRRKRL